MYDKDGYYSDATGKYLTFDLPFDFGKNETKHEEEAALNNAFILGDILNRSVIFPKMHCYGYRQIQLKGVSILFWKQYLTLNVWYFRSEVIITATDF
jgi:hypothetical protein